MSWSRHARGVAMVVGAALGWSTGGLIVRHVAADAWTIVFWRGFFAALTLLGYLAIRDGRIAPKITDVILASPDLDVDVFGKQIQAMGKARPKFTLFVSRDDRALNLSRRISGNIDRLGQIGRDVGAGAHLAREVALRQQLLVG